MGNKRAKKSTYSIKSGFPPGTLVYSGVASNELCRDHTLMLFDSDGASELRDLPDHIPKNKFAWLNVESLSTIEFIKEIGERFEIHDLTLEDIVHLEQRSKLEEHENYIYVVIKMIFLKEDEIKYEQLSIVLKEGLLITFLEDPEDVFNTLRSRLRKGEVNIGKGVRYLFYLLLDQVLDHYFLVAEKLEEKLLEAESLSEKRTLKSSLKQLPLLWKRYRL